MKRVILLVAASLLLIWLVSPACTNAPALAPVLYTFEDGKIRIGVAGDFNSTAGEMQWAGAMLAQQQINGAGGVDVDGVPHILELIKIETGEETADPAGLSAIVNLTAAIEEVDFILGGLRAEALEVYRDVAMERGIIFINCGAAAEALQHSVVDDYEGYRFWFKGTPANEYFSGQSVVRILRAVATQLRQNMGVPANYELRAAIVADNLPWAYRQVVVITGLLEAINVRLVNDPYWVNAKGNAVEMQGVLTSIAGLNPHFIIPVLSADAGVLYDVLRAAHVPNAMSVGINVMAQIKRPWGAGNLTTPPPGGPACAYQIILDSWAEGLEQTEKTAAFLNAFMANSDGEYPLHTAATYDVVLLLEEVIEAVAWYDARKGAAYAWADDIIQRLEGTSGPKVTTTGLAAYYPRPEAKAAGKQALSEVQVRSLYDLDSYNYTYNATHWTMPPHTTHDLAYGPSLLSGIGAQWQWDAREGRWKKVGVWPTDFGDEYDRALTDQYGCWNFAYNGTKRLVIPQNVITHHKPP